MRVILIGGAQRTGTTLVNQILCAVPGAHRRLREAAYLRRLVAVYTDCRRAADPSVLLADYFDDAEDLRRFHAGLARAFLERTAARLGREGALDLPPLHILVLKEPHLTLHFPECFDLLGEAVRFVVMVRDPRDVVASMRRVADRLAAGGMAHFVTQKRRDAAALAKAMLQMYGRVLTASSEVFRRRVHFLRYEDLVGRPLEAADWLGRVLDIDMGGFDPALPLEPPSSAGDDTRPVGAFVEAWRGEGFGGHVLTSRVGTWPEMLTEDEAARVMAVCAEFNRKFGYA